MQDFLRTNGSKILGLTGLFTMLPGLQFIAPWAVLELNGLRVTEDSGLLFAQHWGLLVSCMGALVILAAFQPAWRGAVLLAAAIEKLGLVSLLLMRWQDPAWYAFRPVVYFDSICILLYTYYLWQHRTHEAYERSSMVSPFR